MGSFTFIEHTADIAVRIKAVSLEDLFETAHSAYLNSIGEINTDYVIDCETIDLKFESPEPEYLLVDFLSEINYNLLVKKEAAISIESLSITSLEGNLTLEATILQRRLRDGTDRLVKEIKAITYHNLSIVKRNNYYTVDIVFDI